MLSYLMTVTSKLENCYNHYAPVAQFKNCMKSMIFVKMEKSKKRTLWRKIPRTYVHSMGVCFTNTK